MCGNSRQQWKMQNRRSVEIVRFGRVQPPITVANKRLEFHFEFHRAGKTGKQPTLAATSRESVFDASC